MRSPILSKPGTPVEVRLARRLAGAQALLNSENDLERASGKNRMPHIVREAEAAGFSLKDIEKVAKTLGNYRAVKAESGWNVVLDGLVVEECSSRDAARAAIKALTSEEVTA